MALPYTATANTKMLLRFDSTSSTTDATGNVTNLVGGPGSTRASSIAAGKFSRSAHLWGTLSRGNRRSFMQSSADFTMAMWVKPAEVPLHGSAWTFFQHGYDTDRHAIQYIANFNTPLTPYYLACDRFRFSTALTKNFATLRFTHAYTLPLDSYTHLIYTYDDSEKTLTLYINGILAAQDATGYVTTQTGVHSMDYGNINSQNGYFTGSMIYDDLVLEDTAWSPEKAAFVAGGPLITAHPQPATKDPGDTVTFSVSALGDDLTYQWQVSENNGAFTDMTGETSSTLSFVTSFPLSYNKYRVSVSTDTATLYSDSALLKVNYNAVSGMLAWFHFDEGYIDDHRVDVDDYFGDYNYADWPYEKPALAGYTGYNWASPTPYDYGLFPEPKRHRGDPIANIGGSLDFRGWTGTYHKETPDVAYSGIAGPYNYIRSANAFRYRDTEDYIDLDTSSFTVMTWIRLPWESMHKRFDYIGRYGSEETEGYFTYQYAGQGPIGSGRWQMGVYGSYNAVTGHVPSIEYRFYSGTGSTSPTNTKTYYLTDIDNLGFIDAEWHHLASVIDRVNNTITTYFDGVPSEQILDISDMDFDLTDPYTVEGYKHTYTIEMPPTTMEISAPSVVVGSLSNDYQRYMSLDDHRLYKRALEPNEIKGIYDSTTFGFDFWADDRSVPVNTPIIFTPTGVFDFGVSGYNWTYGDGSASTGYTGYHSYTGNNSSYDVSLLMQSDTGSTGLEYKVDYIRVEDVITYTIDDQYYYNGEGVTFTGGATGVPGPITYKWQKEE